jgi:TMEM175 potassium channel family protein
MADRDDEMFLRVARVEAFSDGVFAIAITLLVLELSVPPGSEEHLLSAVLSQWPSYLGYIVSFATIGAIWLGHNSITHYLHSASTTFLRLNLALLLVVSFLPFPTKLLAENLGNRSGERVAATIYGCTLLGAMLLLSLLWVTAVRGELVHPDTDDEEIKLLTARLRPSLALYIVLIIVGVFTPLVAVIGYLFVAFILIFPIRLRRRQKAEPAVS